MPNENDGVAEIQDEQVSSADIDQEGADAIAAAMSADTDLESDAVADSIEGDDQPNAGEKSDEKAEEISDADLDSYIRAAVGQPPATQQPATESAKPKMSEKVAKAKEKLASIKDKIKDLDGEAVAEGLETIVAMFEEDKPEGDAKPQQQAQQGQRPDAAIIRTQLHGYVDGLLPDKYASPQAKDQLIQVAELVAFGAQKNGKPVGDAAAILAAHRMLERAKNEGRKASQSLRHSGQPASKPANAAQRAKPADEVQPRRKLTPDEEGILAVKRAMRTPAKT